MVKKELFLSKRKTSEKEKSGDVEKYFFIGFIIVLLSVILVDTRFTGYPVVSKEFGRDVGLKESELKTLKNRLDQIPLEMNDLTKKKDALGKELGPIQGEINKLLKELKLKRELEVGAIDKEIDGLRREKDKLEKDVNIIKKKKTKTNADNSKLDKYNILADGISKFTKLKTTTADLKNKKGKYSDLLGNIGGLISEENEIKGKIEIKQMEIDDLNSQLSTPQQNNQEPIMGSPGTGVLGPTGETGNTGSSGTDPANKPCPEGRERVDCEWKTAKPGEPIFDPYYECGNDKRRITPSVNPELWEIGNKCEEMTGEKYVLSCCLPKSKICGFGDGPEYVCGKRTETSSQAYAFCSENTMSVSIEPHFYQTLIARAGSPEMNGCEKLNGKSQVCNCKETFDSLFCSGTEKPTSYTRGEILVSYTNGHIEFFKDDCYNQERPKKYYCKSSQGIAVDSEVCPENEKCSEGICVIK